MGQYRCPVCKKPLTREEYEQALGILEAREQHLLKHRLARYERQVETLKDRAKRARTEGIRFERSRTQRLLAGRDREIQRLRERIAQLKKGSTPQTEGLEFVENLLRRLRREFGEEDRIQHEGKNGNILHTVRSERKVAGLIIHECKRTPDIKTTHIVQAKAAKQARGADFAVLVTTGQRSGFAGLAERDGVLVVHPLGVVALAALLRMMLVELVKARVSERRRAIVARELMKFITSPQFKNPIEEVVHASSELQDMIKEEAKDHFNVWKKRWNLYQTIGWDGRVIQQNIHRILSGKPPSMSVQPQRVPLQLLAPSAGG